MMNMYKFGVIDSCGLEEYMFAIFFVIWLFLNYALVTSELLQYQDRHDSLRITFKGNEKCFTDFLFKECITPKYKDCPCFVFVDDIHIFYSCRGIVTVAFGFHCFISVIFIASKSYKIY